MRPAAIPLFAAALILCPAHAATLNMKDGLWEITTKMDFSGRRVSDCPKQ